MRDDEQWNGGVKCRDYLVKQHTNVIYNEKNSCRPAKTHRRYFRNEACIFVCPPFFESVLGVQKKTRKNSRSTCFRYIRKRGHIFSVMAC